MKDTATDFSHQGNISETQQLNKGEFFQVRPYASVFKCSHQARASHNPDGESGGHPTVCDTLQRSVCVIPADVWIQQGDRGCIICACCFRSEAVPSGVSRTDYSISKGTLDIRLCRPEEKTWFDIPSSFPSVTAALNTHDLCGGLASERACCFLWRSMRVFSGRADMNIKIE